MASERVEVITRAERRRRWSLAEKVRLVLATREPGATVAAVAREHSVSESLLYTWRGRLAQGGLVDASRATHLTGFVPVTVVGGQPGSAMDSGEVCNVVPPTTIEIELPNGCRLRVHERLAASTLRKVIAVLSGIRPAC